MHQRRMVQVHLLARTRKRRRHSIRHSCQNAVAICQARHDNADATAIRFDIQTWRYHVPTCQSSAEPYDQNLAGTWSLTQPPRTALCATSSTSTSVRIIVSVSACHQAKTEASVSSINCANNGTNVSFRFARPRFVSVYESTTRRSNARRTHRTLKCSLVERPS